MSEEKQSTLHADKVIAIMVRQHSDWRLGQTNKHTDQEGDIGMGCFMENTSYILN